MSRSWFLWVGLLGLCIAGAIIRCPDNRCSAQPPELVRPPKQDAPVAGKQHQTVTKNVVGVINPNNKLPAAPVFETKVEGFGENDDDANQDAVKEACNKVAEFLRKTYGETEYTPTPEELKSRRIVGAPEFETSHLPVTGDMHKAIVEVKVTGDQVKDFRESARKVRVNERMKIAGLALAGFVALVLVGGGYLRMEEATKGYYTTLLRVAAIGILIVVAGALLGGFFGH